MFVFLVLRHRAHYFKDYLDRVIKYLSTHFQIQSKIITYAERTKHVSFIGNIDTIIFVQQIHWGVYHNRKKGNMFLLNTEQMTMPSYSSAVINEVLKSGLPVIDYSMENIKLLTAKYPTVKCIHLPFPINITHHTKTNNVCSLGNSPHRKAVMESIKDCIDFNGKWGSDRDVLIQSSKILVNVHYNETYNIFETIRCYHALEYGTLVVSEPSILMNDILLKDSIIFAKNSECIPEIVDRVLNRYSVIYDEYFGVENVTKINALLKETYTQSVSEITAFTTRKNYLYIHVCTMGNWKEILSGMYSKVVESGLIHHLTAINVSICGKEKEDVLSILDHSKVNIIVQTEDTSQFERICLSKIHEKSMSEDCNICYMHTKGVTKAGNQKVKDWVDLMLYFMIEKFNLCIDGLKEHDTVGIMLNMVPPKYMHTCSLTDPSMSAHYSGNFWWARSEYIRTLISKIGNAYIDPELWIASGTSMKMLSLWQTSVDHYIDVYPKKLYEGKVQNFVYTR